MTCKDTVEEIRDDYNNWFQTKLWPAVGRSYFERMRDAMRQKFGGNHGSCLTDITLPPRPPNLGNTTYPEPIDLYLAIIPINLTVRRWVEKMTTAAQCVQDGLPAACKQDPAMLHALAQMRRMVLLLRSPIGTPVPTDPPVRLCENLLNWYYRFYQWGVALAAWSDAYDNSPCGRSHWAPPTDVAVPGGASAPLPDGPVMAAGRRDDLTPPPWPPWGGTFWWWPIDDERFGARTLEVAFSELLTGVTKELAAVAQRTWERGPAFFPGGITEIQATLKVDGAGEVSVTIKGPDPKSASPGSDAVETGA